MPDDQPIVEQSFVRIAACAEKLLNALRQANRLGEEDRERLEQAARAAEKLSELHPDSTLTALEATYALLRTPDPDDEEGETDRGLALVGARAGVLKDALKDERAVLRAQGYGGGDPAPDEPNEVHAPPDASLATLHDDAAEFSAAAKDLAREAEKAPDTTLEIPVSNQSVLPLPPSVTVGLINVTLNIQIPADLIQQLLKLGKPPINLIAGIAERTGQFAGKVSKAAKRRGLKALVDVAKGVAEAAERTATHAERLLRQDHPPPSAPPSPRRSPGDTFQDAPYVSEMIVISPGTFLMGSPANEKGRYKDEGPQHEVTIAYPFALGVYPVMFAEWDAARVAGARLENPKDNGWGRGRRPVINVSWDDICDPEKGYFAWLNDTLGLTGREDVYRLPSEAEWEYACRAGTQTRYWFGDDEAALGDHAWFSGNAGGQTHPVGEKPANPFGLYDMHGNVWEWCADGWHWSYDGADRPDDGRAWTSGGETRRVRRGGSWSNYPRFLRSAFRGSGLPEGRDYYQGFRLARTVSR